MSYLCNICNLSFENSKSLANHKYNAHSDLVTVTLDDVSVSRVDGKFTCPKCSKKLTSPTTLKRHVGKPHDRYRAVSSIRKKRLYSEVGDNNNNNNSSSIDTINANDSNNSNDNSQSVNISHHQMQASRLNLDEHSSSSSSITNSSLPPKCRSILMASDAIGLSEKEKEKFLMLSKIGNWEPIIMSSMNGKKYYMLTSQTTIDHVLADQPTGAWMLPT